MAVLTFSKVNQADIDAKVERPPTSEGERPTLIGGGSTSERKEVKILRIIKLPIFTRTDGETTYDT